MDLNYERMDSEASDTEQDPLTGSSLKIQPSTANERSLEKYNSCYNKFKEWIEQNNAGQFSDDALLNYFHELSREKKPPTMWAIYSMLKSTIYTRQNIDISQYPQLTAFLKKNSIGYKSKPLGKPLTTSQIAAFLDNAPDDFYLATKVALIFGLTGTCRTDELVQLVTDDVEDDGTMLLVRIRELWGRKARSFTIVGEFYKIVKKYIDQRPERVTNQRFFLRYQNGKYVNLAIGKHKFGAMAKSIASYLKLPNPEEFTGHSIRRTSLALIACSSENRVTLKAIGRADKPSTAGFMAQAINFKRNMSQQLTEAILSDHQPAFKKIRIDNVNSVPSTSGTGSKSPQHENSDSKGQFLEVEVKNEFDEIYLDDSIDALDLEPDEMDTSNDSPLPSAVDEVNPIANPIQTGCKELDSMLNPSENAVTLEDDKADNKEGIVDDKKKGESPVCERSTDKLNDSGIEKVIDRLVDRLGIFCQQVEKNNKLLTDTFSKFFDKLAQDSERRHQELVDLRLEELEVQKQALALKERQLLLKEKQLKAFPQKLTEQKCVEDIITQ